MSIISNSKFIEHLLKKLKVHKLQLAHRIFKMAIVSITSILAYPTYTLNPLVSQHLSPPTGVCGNESLFPFIPRFQLFSRHITSPAKIRILTNKE